MDRRRFLSHSVAGGVSWTATDIAPPAPAFAPSTPSPALPPGITPTAFAIPHTSSGPFTTPDYYIFARDLHFERPSPRGKVADSVARHAVAL